MITALSIQAVAVLHRSLSMLFDHNKTAGTAQPNHLSKYFAHQQEFNHGVTATFAQFQLIEHTDTTGEMTMERRENDGDLLQYLR
jgi:hypothetical protein